MSSSKSTWITLIALAKGALPDPLIVLAMLARLKPDEPPPVVASQSSGMVTFEWGEVTAAYTLVPRAIASSQLIGPCETAWYWPQAWEALREHQAHLLVTLLDETRDPLQKAMRLTALSTSIARAAEGLGIFWAPAGLVHQPAAFAEQAQEMSSHNLPLYLWIGFRLQPEEQGGYRLFTTGLEAFDRKELEVTDYAGDAQQLLNDVYNVAHYLLDQPSAIKDADTIGLPDGRQAVASHEASQLSDDRQVIRLQF